MDPVSIGLLGSGIISGIGNFLSNSSANDRAAALQDKVFQQWMQLHIPDPAEQKVAMERFVSQGQLTPVMQQAIAQSPTEFSKIVTSSQDKAAQNRALSELSNIGNQGGLRLQDKSALQDARLGAQTRERSNRLGVADEMSRRGLSGSGYDVAARLSGQQGTADQEANAGLKVAADAQNRALQSIMGAGKLAGDYRSQDFNEQSAKASAADKINAFNTANLRNVNAANTQAENYSNEANLKNKQKISDQNTTVSNAEQQYNKGLVQQQFDNQVKQLAGATGQANALAGTTQKGGQLLGNTISNVGSSLGNYAALDSYFSKKPASSADGSGYSLPDNLKLSLNKAKDDDDYDYG